MKINTQFILTGDAEYILIGQYISDEGKPVRQFLTDKKYTIQDTETTYRVVNNWSSAGLLEENRENHNQWRKFNIVDLVWLYIITELRKLGFPLEKIRKARETLFYTGQNPKKIIPLLDIYIIQALERKPVHLIILEDGQAMLALEDEYNLSKEYLSLTTSHIIISLNRIVQKLFTRKDLSPIYEHSAILTREELNLFFLARSGEYEKIIVSYRNGKAESFMGTQTIQNHERIGQILKEHDYQDITIVKEKGKVIKIKRVVKKKL